MSDESGERHIHLDWKSPAPTFDDPVVRKSFELEDQRLEMQRTQHVAWREVQDRSHEAWVSATEREVVAWERMATALERLASK